MLNEAFTPAYALLPLFETASTRILVREMFMFRTCGKATTGSLPIACFAYAPDYG